MISAYACMRGQQSNDNSQFSENGRSSEAEIQYKIEAVSFSEEIWRSAFLRARVPILALH